MDPDAVDRISHGFTAQAAELDHVALAVKRLIHEMETTWRGAHADEFAGWWHHQHGPALAALTRGLSAHALSLKANAQKQRQVSAAGGGHHFSHVGWTHHTQDVFTMGGVLGGTFGQREWGGGENADHGRHGKKDRKDKDGGWHPSMGIGTSGEIGVDATTGMAGAAMLGGVPLAGAVAGSAYAKGGAGANASVSRKGVDANVQAGIAVGVAGTAAGSIGNKNLGAEGSASVKAEADAKADASAHLGPDGSKLSAGAKAGVMASAEAQASGHLGGVDGSVGVKAYAGAGVEAHIDHEVSKDHVKTTIQLGAAIGVGAGWEATIDIHPSQVLHNVTNPPHIRLPHLHGD